MVRGDACCHPDLRRVFQEPAEEDVAWPAQLRGGQGRLHRGGSLGATPDERPEVDGREGNTRGEKASRLRKEQNPKHRRGGEHGGESFMECSGKGRYRCRWGPERVWRVI